MAERARINQQFRLYIEKATNLAKKDIFGASDPYVKVYIVNNLDGVFNPPKTKHVAKTRVIKNTLNPSWKEQFPLSFDPTQQTILLEVWDENRLTRDDLLGLTRAGRIQGGWYFFSLEWARGVLELRGRSVTSTLSGTLYIGLRKEAQVQGFPF